MTHLDLLDTPEFRAWVRREVTGGASNGEIARLRTWWRAMAGAFSFRGYVVPAATIPVPDDQQAYQGSGLDGSHFHVFSAEINRVSALYGLPAPFQESLVGASDVERLLGVKTRRAQQLIAAHPEGRLEGRDWRLPARCLADLRERRGRGRPRKAKDEGEKDSDHATD